MTEYSRLNIIDLIIMRFKTQSNFRLRVDKLKFILGNSFSLESINSQKKRLFWAVVNNAVQGKFILNISGFSKLKSGSFFKIPRIQLYLSNVNNIY